MFKKLMAPLNRFRATATAMLALLLLAACGPVPTPSPAPLDTPVAASPTATAVSSAATKVTIALGYIPDVQFAPFYLAQSKGYYKDEGLDVTFKHGIVPDLIRQLGAGEGGVDFAVASGDEVIPARVQGIPVVYLMTWYRQYPVAAASITGKGPTLTSPADLKGRVVGVPGTYGATYIGLQALLKAGGLTLGDIKLKSIDFTQVPSLAAGQVDIAMVYAANEPTQLRSKQYNVSTLLVSDYAKLASNGLATNDNTLRGNPGLVGKVVRATRRGVEATIKDPVAAFDEAVKQVPNAGGANRDLQVKVLQETVKLMQPKAGDPATGHVTGWTDRDVWSSTQDFLFETKSIPKRGDVSQMFTNDFVGDK